MFMNRLVFLFTCFGLSSVNCFAQRALGVATGNYSALNSMYLNPANIADCGEKLSISLFSLNLGLDNNLGTISSISQISSTLKTNDSGGKNIFNFTNNGKFSMMAPAVDIKGPGVLYRINSHHSIALTTRIRAYNQFNNFDRSLYNTISNPSSVSQGNQDFTSQNFNWTAQIWSEIALTYGGVIINKDKFLLKGGVSLKYLVGVGYLGLKGKNLDVSYQAGSDSIHASHSDVEFASNAQSLSDAFSNGVSPASIFGGSSVGKGIGSDLGLVLLYRPDKDNQEGNGYKMKLSVSVTDIGSINYKNSYSVNVTGNGTLSGTGIANNVKDYQDFRNYVITQGFSADTGVKATKVYLPTAMIVGLDYHAYQRFYINATFIGNLANTLNFGNTVYGQFTITPRYDLKLYSIGLPLTYDMLTHNMRMGLGIRFSGFFMGSDDMMAMFSGHQYGFNFYVGGMIPIFRKPDPLDRDFQL